MVFVLAFRNMLLFLIHNLRWSPKKWNVFFLGCHSWYFPCNFKDSNGSICLGTAMDCWTWGWGIEIREVHGTNVGFVKNCMTPEMSEDDAWPFAHFVGRLIGGYIYIFTYYIYTYYREREMSYRRGETAQNVQAVPERRSVAWHAIVPQ